MARIAGACRSAARTRRRTLARARAPSACRSRARRRPPRSKGLNARSEAPPQRPPQAEEEHPHRPGPYQDQLQQHDRLPHRPRGQRDRLGVRRRRPRDGDPLPAGRRPGGHGGQGRHPAGPQRLPPPQEEARLMARDTGAQCKQCRREGQKLFLKGERCLTDKCGVERRSYPPGDHGRGRQKQSEYRVQLREKQKARRYYGVLEKQFRRYYDEATRLPGITGENLLAILERRFDNVLVRLGFAASRRQARQMIRHGQWTINGRRVDIPSYQVRDGDVIAVKAGTGADAIIRDATELTAQVPAWPQADHDALTAKVLRKPERREITTPVQEQLIVELYSK